MAAKKRRKIKKRKFEKIPEGVWRGIAAAAAFVASFWMVGLTNTCPEPAGAYYSVALEWFCLFGIPVGIGLSQAVSSTVALRLDRGNVGSAKRAVSTAGTAAAALGLVFGLLLFVCSGFLTKSVLQSADAAFVLCCFAPAPLFFFPLLAILGGLDGFGGVRGLSVAKTVFFLLTVIGGTVFAGRLSEYGRKVGALLQNDQYGPAYGAAGGAVAAAFAAFAACAAAVIAWWRLQPDIDLLRWGEERLEKRGQLLAGLVKKLLPIFTVTALLAAGLLGQCLLFFHLSGGGIQKDAGLLSDWAVYAGRIRGLLLIPVAGAVALAVRMVPELKVGFVRRNLKKSRDKCMIALRCASVFATPFTVMAAVLAAPILSAFFGKDAVSSFALLQAGSACILFFALSAMLGGILAGADRSGLLTAGTAAAVILHLAALYGLLFVMEDGVMAVVCSNLILSVLLCVILAFLVQKGLRLRLDWIRILLAPCISGAIMAAVSAFFSFLVFRAAPGPVAAAGSALAGLVFYFVCIITLKGVTQRELRSFPGGGFFLALAKLVRLM